MYACACTHTYTWTCFLWSLNIFDNKSVLAVASIIFKVVKVLLIIGTSRNLYSRVVVASKVGIHPYKIFLVDAQARLAILILYHIILYGFDAEEIQIFLYFTIIRNQAKKILEIKRKFVWTIKIV